MPLLDNSRFRKIIPLLLALLCITACSSEKPEKLAATPPPAGPAVSLPAVKLEAFGALPPAVQETVTPAFKEPAATVDRAVNVKQVMDFLGVRLTPAQKKFIQDHKFLLIPKSATKFKDKVDLSGESEDPFDEMLGLFDYLSGSGDPMNRKPENCRFVNPDVMLQAFHKYFENSLEYLEKTELAGTLRRFLTAMQAKALEYKADSKAPLAEHYELIAAQLTVPLVILENARWPNPEEKIPTSPPPTPPPADDRDTLENALKILGKDKDKFSEPVFNRMVAELQLIFGARDQAPSPLFGQYAKEEGAKADYTQFTPRSHYVKNSLLRSYFRAMIYLGRNGYLLGNPAGITDAMLAAIVMASPGPAGSPPPLQDWQRIMELTGFYAGQPDDIGYPQWRDFLVKVLGAGKISSGEAVNPEILEKISRNLGELQKPRIFSEVVVSPEVLTSTKEQLLEKSKSFRIFGQRFTLDAWVLNRLTAGQEKTPVRLPSMPTALFIPAVLGDQAALRFADQYLRKLTPPFTPDETYQFEGRMNEVAADLTRVTDSEWFSSLSSAWLKLLGTLTSPYGRGYPLYMQDRLFPVKQVESFLGSYAELKHDTVLYAKQSYAERGGGGDEGDPPPVPKGFVEPNLAFWQTLARLVDYVDSGFARYGIFKNELEEYGRLKRFKESVAFYTTLAAKELRGEPLTGEEYEKLRTSELMYMAAPFEMGMVLQEKDMRSALIADIHTDTVAQQILYEAVGEPYVMLVLVGNDDTVRLAVGVAFNHYELTGPLATRYTDADWQNRVYEHEPPLPPKNFWYQGLMTK